MMKVAIAVLLVLVLLIGGGNLLATRSYVGQFRAQEQANGKLIEQKLCDTLIKKLSAVRPPAPLPPSQLSPLINPSREYDEQLHDVLAALAVDINCPSN